MVSIVLASHGDLAAGIKQTGSMVFGDQPSVAVVSLEPSMGPDDFRAKVEEAIASFEDQEQVLFLVDLWGGTPFNQISGLIEGHDSWAIVTGVNLPMLIEAYSQRFDAKNTAHAIAKHLVTEAKAGVRVKPESLVIGDGHIQIAHVRIDTRLLHGQVATTWTKQINPNRIIVVSDGVAHDELRKTMIEQAAPPGVHANVVPIKKMAEVVKDTRFGDTKAMLLFENPQDLLKAIEAGVDIKEANIGSMAHSKGKVVVTNAVAMGDDDVKTLEALKAKGVKFEVRKVPSDSSEDLDAMLKKAKAELAAQA